MPGSTSIRELDRSVHKGIGCAKCHIDVSGYPHGRVGAVECGICHFLGRDNAPREQALAYKLSVHGAAARLGKKNAPGCQTCHGSHAIFPSAEERSATHKLRVPALCGTCHSAERADYEKSVHGISLVKNGNTGAPSCFDCHLEHGVPSTSDPSWKLSLIRECGTCHAEQLDTYHKTFHGKVTRLGYETMAKCSDCHGSHLIMGMADAGSLLAPARRLAVCRTCHPNATEGFAKYYAHADELDRSRYPELFWTYTFMTTLLLSVFAFFFTHTFLWAYRSLKEKMRKKGGR